jgi:hypothetical protein
LYPIDLVKRTGVWRIVLCEDMTYKGQPRTAFPDWEHHTLYFDVDVDRHSELRFRKAIHHEFFHMIDYADDGSFEDAQWGALNPKGFKYGIGGASAQRDYSSGDIKLDLPGFLNRYCQTGVEEDKAEMFCYMMVNGKELEEHAATDPIIHAKMQRMKQMLKGFCPEVDEQFWQAARKVPRPSDWPLRSVPVEQNVLPTVNPRHAAGDPRFFVLLRRWIAVGVAIVLVLIATRAIYRSTVVSK